MQNETYNPKYHINVDLEQEVNSYDVETKFNDYIGMQKKIPHLEPVVARAEINNLEQDTMKLGYKCFKYDEVEFREVEEFATEKGWKIALIDYYADEFYKYTDDSRYVVYGTIDDLPQKLKERVVHPMTIKYETINDILGREIGEMFEENILQEELKKILTLPKEQLDEWFNDYNRGWICDTQGEVVGIKKVEAKLIERYERETEIPVEERIINSQNNFQLKDNVSKEQYLKIYDEACTYDRLEQCEKEGLYWEIKSLKFSPTNSLIKGIRQFSRMEGKNYSFREVAELHKTNPDFSDNPKKARCFEDIIKECQEQELAKMKEAITFFKQEMMMEV